MKFALIGAAALVTAASVTPALAQAVIEDPGYCAQFYPNANCQNLGNPYENILRRPGMRHGRLNVLSSARTGIAMQAIDLNFNLAS